LKAEYESKLKEDEARLERLDQENQELEAELKEVLIQVILNKLCVVF
jgi:uncharacterized protein (UPF0335 family)